MDELENETIANLKEEVERLETDLAFQKAENDDLKSENKKMKEALDEIQDLTRDFV